MVSILKGMGMLSEDCQFRSCSGRVHGEVHDSTEDLNSVD